MKSVMDKKFWAATFTLSGTIIGAGILGLPYVFSKSGFFIGLFWLLFLGSIIILTKLYLGEVILRTKGTHQLTGYANKYLGKWGKWLMLFEMLFGVYSALLAYLIGEGQSFSNIFPGVEKYALYFTIGFWILMTLLLREGLKGLKKIETWGVIAISVLVIGIFVWYSPGIKIENITFVNINNLFLPFGVVLFAMLGFSALPEVKRELKGNQKMMMKVILFGTAIPLILYILFSFIFVSNLGANVPQVATLAFGKIVILLGIFTMLTSYFVLSFALRDMFVYDFKIDKIKTFIMVSLLPILFFLILYYFNLMDFVGILGVGGVVSAGLTGVLVLLMNVKAKKNGDRKPEYSIRINWWIIGIISAVFLFGVAIEIGLVNYLINLI